jgi:peptide-methionine (S)-S-oxide reductase
VGYTGGTSANPTYHSLGDHTETVEIDYDPEVVSYANLLKIFWESHDPTRPSWSKQYKSAIFYHDDEQKKLAMESKERFSAEGKRKVYTEVLPASTFYRAEDYHQKYYLRRKSDMVEVLRRILGGEAEFENSKIAARLNGYFAGYGTRAEIEQEIAGMDLPERESRAIWSALLDSKR